MSSSRSAKILFVQGRTFKVKTMYLQDPASDYIDAALRCIYQIHYSCPPGDILVFLAGQEEIENLRAQIEKYLPSLDAKKMQVSCVSDRYSRWSDYCSVAPCMPFVCPFDPIGAEQGFQYGAAQHA